MSAIITPTEGYMCPYYKRDEKSPNFFYCTSPRNASPLYRFCSDGAHRRKFKSYCCSPCGGKGKDICESFVEMPSASDQRGIMPAAAANTVNAQGQTSVEKVSSNSGSRYTFVKEKNMCMYWSRDEENEKKYHCASPGNPHGPGETFATTGGTEAVTRFRKQCRKADEEGLPPCCDFFPGKGSEDDKEGDGSGEFMKKLLKAGVKTAIDPAGGIKEGLENIAMDMIDAL